jgi:hypothetical protein
MQSVHPVIHPAPNPFYNPRSYYTFGKILPRIIEQSCARDIPLLFPFLLLYNYDVREICYCIVFLFILCVFNDTPQPTAAIRHTSGTHPAPNPAYFRHTSGTHPAHIRRTSGVHPAYIRHPILRTSAV